MCFFYVSMHDLVTYRIPEIGPHDAFINFHVKSKFQLSRFYRLLVVSKSILICQNSRTKQSSTRSREVPTTEQMVHYAFMRELTADNYYHRNCVDLKPVPIIRFLFQFGFQIVWDLDPSVFGILNAHPY